MKQERIRVCIKSTSLSLLKNIQWTVPLQNAYSFLYKSFLLFLFSFSFSQTIYGEKIPTFDKNQLRVNEIKAIPNPHERGVAFLISLYETSIKAPKQTKDFVKKTELLWLDTYPLKDAFLLLGKAEIAQSNGTFINTTNNTLKAIRIIETSEETTSKKKILCMAYLAYARYTQFTKEKNGIDYGYKALQVAEGINFTIGKIIAHDLIGTLRGYFNKDYQLALKHYQKAEKLLPQLESDSTFLKYWVLANIAKAWSDLGYIEKSIDYKLNFLTDSVSNDNILLLIAVYNNLGTNYFDLKRFDEAEKTLQITIDLMKQHKVIYHLGVPLLRMGLIKLEQKNIIGAVHYADAIDFWLLEQKFIGNYQVVFYQFKSKIAKAKKDYEQAILWLEKASIEQDSIDRIAGANNLIHLEESAKLREIKRDQLILEKELALNKATINTQYVILSAISLIAILSLWFGITFYEKNKEITEAYDYILSQNNEKQQPSKSTQKTIEGQTITTSKDIDEGLKQKIIHSLSVDKSFLSSDLTLKKFADLVESNTSYVSQTINAGFGKNFNALINEYRIEEVLRLFQEGQHQTFTIESIYQKAGFKSKSSFQKAFKAKTGVTATHYLNHIS